jgi:hypothetical protein
MECRLSGETEVLGENLPQRQFCPSQNSTWPNPGFKPATNRLSYDAALRRPLTGLLYQPRMIDDDECGAVVGMRISRRNRSTLRKPSPVPLCPPQDPHDLTWTLNPSRRRGKLATNRLSYGKV